MDLKRTLADISSETGVPTATLSRWMKKWGVTAERHTESFVGDTFGQWVVLSETTGGSRGRPTLCRCRCACGTERMIPRGNLHQGLTRSCGCLHRLEPGLAGLHKVIDGYKRSAQHRGLDFTLSLEEVARLTSEPCWYCNTPPQQLRRERSSRSHYLYNGMDRQDPTKGYTTENVVSACWRCNRNKAAQTVAAFLEWVRTIREPVFVEPTLTAPLPPPWRAARNNYRSKARWRRLPFELSDEQVASLFAASCAYCGARPANGMPGKEYTGIDRLDNTIGYTPENCVPACQRCNYAKLDQTLTSFIEWSRKVQTHTASISSR
jgi:5-methylcytosine-specific restriction endonuclease McrA